MRALPSSDPWSRRRLMVVLVASSALVVLMLLGLVLMLVGTLRSENRGEQGRGWDEKLHPVQADGTRGAAYRDAIAARPMLASTADDLAPAPPALDRAGVLRVPPSSREGVAGVPSGFPQTAAGAVAQLAAIDSAVLTPMSIDFARTVFDSWSVTGARFDRWPLARSISSFHEAAGTVDGDGTIAMSAVPVGAVVKGTDGPGWVLACVQMDIRVRVVREARFGYGDCERMAWHGDRWLIDSGVPPAPAPSTWPDSERSRKAGWLTWVEQGEP